MQFKIFFGSSWPRGIFRIKWKNTWNLRNQQTNHVHASLLSGWRVTMRDCYVMLANIGTYCLIKSSLRHSPFNLGTVKKTSNITMKQNIYQSEYAILPSSWPIPTAWYPMIGSPWFLTHPLLPFNREVTSHSNLRPLLMLPVQREHAVRSNVIDQKHMWREPTLLIWVAFMLAVWLFLGLIIDCESTPVLSATDATVQELHSWISLKFTCRGLLAQPLQEDSLVLGAVSMMQFCQVKMHDQACHACIPKNQTHSYTFQIC